MSDKIMQSMEELYASLSDDELFEIINSKAGIYTEKAINIAILELKKRNTDLPDDVTPKIENGCERRPEKHPIRSFVKKTVITFSIIAVCYFLVEYATNINFRLQFTNGFIYKSLHSVFMSMQPSTTSTITSSAPSERDKLLNAAVNKVETEHTIYVSDDQVPAEYMKSTANLFEEQQYPVLTAYFPEVKEIKDKAIVIFVGSETTGAVNDYNYALTEKSIEYWGSLIDLKEIQSQAYGEYLWNGIIMLRYVQGTSSAGDPDVGTLHEYIHYMDDYIYKNVNNWMDESLASYFGYQWGYEHDPRTANLSYSTADLMNFYQICSKDEQPPDLMSMRYYDHSDWGSEAFYYLMCTYGMDHIREYFNRIKQTPDVNGEIFTEVFGISPSKFTENFYNEVLKYKNDPNKFDKLNGLLRHSDLFRVTVPPETLPDWMNDKYIHLFAPQ